MQSNGIEEESISIRMIQHYLYCPHRWGLLEIDKAWAENYFVTKANILHERVHNPIKHYHTKNKKIYSSVEVYNHSKEYNIFGVLDSLEICTDFEKSSPAFNIVEYKPTKPKTDNFRFEDAMQVFAQKICVDSIFHCNCTGYLYYGNTKDRIKLPLQDEFDHYNQKLILTLQEMRNLKEYGIIPSISNSQKCHGCSLKDLCIPKLKTPKKNIQFQLKELLND